MDDCRCYGYRFNSMTRRWSYLALDNTNMMKHEFMLEPIETWQTQEGKLYTLCNVFYSRQRAMLQAKEYETRPGTLIMQLQCGGENVCLIRVSHTLRHTLEIRTEQNQSLYISDHVLFEELKSMIQYLLSLSIIGSIIHYPLVNNNTCTQTINH